MQAVGTTSNQYHHRISDLIAVLEMMRDNYGDAPVFVAGRPLTGDELTFQGEAQGAPRFCIDIPPTLLEQSLISDGLRLRSLRAEAHSTGVPVSVEAICR